MLITQLDIARLSDDTIRRMVITLREAAGGAPPASRSYTQRHAAALVRALNERHRRLAVAELELADDEEGSLMEPGTDPAADAQAELRRGSPDGPVP
jgi:hypothetical protein